MTDDTTTLRLRTQRLFEYLQAVRALRERPVRDIAQYQNRRWWAADLPAHPACRVTIDGDEPWLVISKADLPPFPAPSDEITEFIAGPVNDPGAEPRLVSDLDELLADDVDRYVAVTESFDQYLECWRGWAPNAAVALVARKLYEDLYDLRLRLQREEAYIELVWGHGVLTWEVAGERVVHPMVTTRVQISFDADTGDIRVAPEAMSSHLEIDVLQGLGVGGFDLLVDIRDRFRTEPIGPFDPQARHLYEQLLHPLGLDGAVSETERPPAPSAAPLITPTWGLFVRRRSTLYQRFFASLRDALADEAFAVPGPLAAVVADAPSELDADGFDGSWHAVGERLMMPLPTNPEQEQVVKRLATHRGVTVQGPPGTGKTHTIANLISHLVAHGKRVLVTSQKEQALAVLRDKMPEDLRPLCVSVLGSSSTSLAELDQSVQAIYERAVGLDRNAAHREVDAYTAELDQAQREVSRLRDRIRTVAERERAVYHLGDTEHTPTSLAQYLAGTSEQFSYIPDILPLDGDCPLTADELVALYALATALEPADCAAGRLRLPNPEELPVAADLSAWVAELADIADRLADTEDRLGDLRSIDALGAAGVADLIGAAESAAERLAALEGAWLATVRNEAAANPAFAATWRDHLKVWQEGIEEIAVWKGSLAGHRVRLPAGDLPSRETLELLGQLRDRLAAGRGVSKMFARDLHRLRTDCAVDEEEPRSADDIELCITEARVRRRRYELVLRWNDEVARVGGPTIGSDDTHPEFALDRSVTAVVKCPGVGTRRMAAPPRGARSCRGPDPRPTERV